MSKLARIKAGITNHRIIDFPGSNEKVAIVVLSSEDLINARSDAMQYIENKSNIDNSAATLIFNAFTLYRALRDTDDPEFKRKFAESPQEILGNLSAKEIVDLMDQYLDIQDGADISLETLTEEQLEEIKNALRTLQLNELNGESCVHLRNFLLSHV